MSVSHIIAIDGYVATGKGTTAQGVARQLGYLYLDTGAMYRAVTLYALGHQLLDVDEQTKADMMRQIKLSFQYNAETDHDDIWLNGENVEQEIRQVSLTSQMKPIVTSPAVRSALVQMQSQFGRGGLVADGRDMGTVVFPHADLKVFLICDAEVRAQRRYRQLQEQNNPADLDAIYRDIVQRDETDYLGVLAVNKKADDAIVIDTTHLSIQEVVSHVVTLFHQNIKQLL